LALFSKWLGTKVSKAKDLIRRLFWGDESLGAVSEGVRVMRAGAILG
jgi:hypothetical protein